MKKDIIISIMMGFFLLSPNSIDISERGAWELSFWSYFLLAMGIAIIELFLLKYFSLLEKPLHYWRVCLANGAALSIWRFSAIFLLPHDQYLWYFTPNDITLVFIIVLAQWVSTMLLKWFLWQKERLETRQHWVALSITHIPLGLLLVSIFWFQLKIFNEPLHITLYLHYQAQYLDNAIELNRNTKNETYPETIEVVFDKIEHLDPFIYQKITVPVPVCSVESQTFGQYIMSDRKNHAESIVLKSNEAPRPCSFKYIPQKSKAGKITGYSIEIYGLDIQEPYTYSLGY